MGQGKKTFAQKSRLNLTFSSKEGRAYLEDMYVSPPFKLMRPFFDQRGFIEMMIMSSSPGILEGDRQYQEFIVKEATRARVLSQSYDKVHPMPKGDMARREGKIRVGRQAVFIGQYSPLILYRDSVFENRQDIYLEDETSRLILRESLVAGRVGHGERFDFQSYRGQVRVFLGQEAIYFENSHLVPSQMAYDSLGYFEGYDHYTSLLAFNFDPGGEKTGGLVDLVDRIEKDLDIRPGLTRSYRGDLQVRILGRSGQDLLEASDEIIDYLEKTLDKEVDNAFSR